MRSVFERLWECATPLDEVLEGYEAALAELISARDAVRLEDAAHPRRSFWIEAGYVTKNRGLDRPGNQIFAPNGFRDFFRLVKAPGNSTLISEITFLTEVGTSETRNYRENDNGMEKLTLPVPEENGYGVYDGKVLLFEPLEEQFRLTAIELGDFELAYGHCLSNVSQMNGGRRFGELLV